MPLSVTSIKASHPAMRALTPTCGTRPGGTNLMAVETRFWNSSASRLCCPSKFGSAPTRTSAERSPMLAARLLTTLVSTSSSATGTSSCAVSASVRTKSNMSSSKVRMRRAPSATWPR